MVIKRKPASDISNVCSHGILMEVGKQTSYKHLKVTPWSYN